MLKRWEVEVAGFGAGIYCVPTRGAAMADAWRSDAFNHLTFGQFLKIARCTRSRHKPHRFGDPITVRGKPAFYVDHNRQYTQFAWPDGKFVLSAHPYDVLPEEYRTEAYRDAALPDFSLCEDCPPVGYPTDKTRCTPCPRAALARSQDSDGQAPASTGEVGA